MERSDCHSQPIVILEPHIREVFEQRRLAILYQFDAERRTGLPTSLDSIIIKYIQATGIQNTEAEVTQAIAASLAMEWSQPEGNTVVVPPGEAPLSKPHKKRTAYVLLKTRGHNTHADRTTNEDTQHSVHAAEQHALFTSESPERLSKANTARRAGELRSHNSSLPASANDNIANVQDNPIDLSIPQSGTSSAIAEISDEYTDLMQILADEMSASVTGSLSWLTSRPATQDLLASYTWQTSSIWRTVSIPPRKEFAMSRNADLSSPGVKSAAFAILYISGSQPAAPSAPGAPALVLAYPKLSSYKDVVLDAPVQIFSQTRRKGNGDGAAHYMGLYEHVGQTRLSQSAWISLPEKTRKDWIRRLSERNTPDSKSLRARAILRYLGRSLTALSVRAVMEDEHNAKKTARKKYQINTEKALKKSFDNGTERLHLHAFRCVGSDSALIRIIEAKVAQHN